MSNENKSLTRIDFIRKIVRDTGLTYVDASKAYESFMDAIEDAVVTGSKINFGRVGALTPVKKDPRVVNMGFARGPGGKCEKKSRQFFLGTRIKYKFLIYRRFLQTRTVDWI